MAHFLEKQGFKQQALAVSTDPDHRFELALQIGDMKAAYALAQEIDNEQKWKQMADLATEKADFGLTQDCLHRAQDYGGLLLFASSSGKLIFLYLDWKNTYITASYSSFFKF